MADRAGLLLLGGLGAALLVLNGSRPGLPPPAPPAPPGPPPRCYIVNGQLVCLPLDPPYRPRGGCG